MTSIREPGEPVRERPVGVLGVAFGLLLIAALGFLVTSFLANRFDGAAELERILPAERLPFGLALVESAALPTGERMIRLAADAHDGKGGEGAEPGEEPEPPPDEVILTLYRSPGAVTKLFAAPDRSKEHETRQLIRAWQKDPSFAMHSEMQRGELRWSGWRAGFVRERSFQQGGSWRDSIRVNLSSENRLLVLFAQWPTDTEPSEKRLKDLLRLVDLEPG
ncbi:MAG: hypothetical protein O7B99_16295 [Planctomycetota bacterium]|nr:hypothetical protein [Planctomycetota bacterium]